MSSEGIILLTPSVRVTIRDTIYCWYRKVTVVVGRGGGREGGGWWFAAFQASEERERALSIKVKNPEISVGTKMDFSNSDR